MPELDIAASVITETDLVIIEALQLSPRAPWARIGASIEIDPTTAARRWRRLADTGMAWMTAYPAPLLSAPAMGGYLDLTCRPDALERLSVELSSWSAIATVQRTSSAAQLFCLVGVGTLTDLDDLAHRALASLDGVERVEVNIATRIYREGGEWLVRALNERQRAELVDTTSSTATAARELSPDEQRIALPLGVDGRRSSAEIAEELDLADAFVRRKINRLVRDRLLRFRCDVSHELAGWPLIAQFRLRVPGDQVDAVGGALAKLQQTRLCSAMTGEANMLVEVWLHSMDGITDVDQMIARHFPEVAVRQRDVVLRSVKRMGRLLDERGRNVGYIPIVSWTR